MIKVCFLTSSLGSGGAERTIQYLSTYLVKTMSVDIVSLTDTMFYIIDERVNIKQLGIPSRPCNLVNRIKLMQERFVKIHNYIQQNRPNIIICLMPTMAKYLLHLKNKYDFKLITSERTSPAFDSLLTKKTKKIVFAISDGIIFQTQRAMEYYPAKVQKKGVVIQNGVGNALAYKMPKINLKKRSKKIVAMGRLVPVKNYYHLVKAFEKIYEKYPEYELHIYGEGPESDRLQNLTQKMNLKGKVVFKGACADALAQIADASCYVLTSLFEGMPNALMEAMAIGLPCVATDCPNGPAELIESGVNGLLVPVDDVEKLTRAILRMIEEPSFAEQCGNNARKILLTNSIDIVSEEYRKFIVNIAGKV